VGERGYEGEVDVSRRRDLMEGWDQERMARWWLGNGIGLGLWGVVFRWRRRLSLDGAGDGIEERGEESCAGLADYEGCGVCLVLQYVCEELGGKCWR